MTDETQEIRHDEESLAAIANLPKVELHLHHEGAAPPEFIRRLGEEKSIRLDGVFDADGGYAFSGFERFLRTYEAATAVLKSPEDFHRLTLALLEQSAENGVVYTESFLSPDFCGGGDISAWQDYLAAIREAAEIAERDMGVTLRGVVTCVRHFGPDQARRAARCAAETAGDFITGFGMGGDENQGALKDFAWSFDMAREAGLQLTVHAGEWRGPAEVASAVDDLRVARIGHGVRAAEDPALVEQLAEAGICLEVCPGSNVALGVYKRLADHPIARLRRAGVPVTVSTDDPPFFHTTMRDEYVNLARCFGWHAEDFTTLNRTALAHAFCDETTRAAIAKRLDTQ
ncbi:adenosine deaminase [Roseivivax sp. GX 12232]|uniref:adenosine deaminase n=1 Tax=Roseivivax sp. GX 12232 TaxID=2900547 RepID=UPI001E5ED9AD|nr:adenosine deaminase [Roseivivax sp. GX 12232]MCE0505141.1 adenosine deaminase [Roseivivax sp. GX 12232]